MMRKLENIKSLLYTFLVLVYASGIREMRAQIYFFPKRSISKQAGFARAGFGRAQCCLISDRPWNSDSQGK